MRLSLLAACLLICGCGANTSAPPDPELQTSLPAFVDRVWVVDDSPQVARGDVRVFLADGTLVMTSAHATPATGAWTFDEGRLRITEEGIGYETDILELTPEAFRIRMHNPGEPVVIGFVSMGEVLHIAGRVQYLDLEGGQYVISDAAGTNFSPLDLPAEFRVEGLAVEVDARRRDDVMSIGMTGPVIELLRIRRSADAAGDLPPLAGIWTVVGHHLPGISAMDDAQARRWYGRTLRLESGEAVFAEARCDAPGYEQSSVARAELLAGYRLGPDALAPLAAVARPAVLDVSCDGAAWSAAGGRLIGIDGDRALVPWDGAFFELQRDRDFRALGQEPGWRLDLRKGKELHFLYDYGEHEVLLPAPLPEVQAGNTVYHAVAAGHDLRLTILPGPCSDAMSGQPFEAQVAIVFDGRSFEGCGGAGARAGDGG